jgi:hypothetical protein
MAEMQEEILWLCEAAHVPVLWATQVLESLAKEGVSRWARLTSPGLNMMPPPSSLIRRRSLGANARFAFTLPLAPTSAAATLVIWRVFEVCNSGVAMVLSIAEKLVSSHDKIYMLRFWHCHLPRL